MWTVLNIESSFNANVTHICAGVFLLRYIFLILYVFFLPSTFFSTLLRFCFALLLFNKNKFTAIWSWQWKERAPGTKKGKKTHPFVVWGDSKHTQKQKICTIYFFFSFSRILGVCMCVLFAVDNACVNVCDQIKEIFCRCCTGCFCIVYWACVCVYVFLCAFLFWHINWTPATSINKSAWFNFAACVCVCVCMDLFVWVCRIFSMCLS